MSREEFASELAKRPADQQKWVLQFVCRKIAVANKDKWEDDPAMRAPFYRQMAVKLERNNSLTANQIQAALASLEDNTATVAVQYDWRDGKPGVLAEYESIINPT